MELQTLIDASNCHNYWPMQHSHHWYSRKFGSSTTKL